MILVDSNIPMYLVGKFDPLRGEAHRLVESLITRRQRLVTDAEVLQEILHRYLATNRRASIQPAFDALLNIVDEVFPMDRGAVERGKQLALEYPKLSARDAVHLAVMQQQGVDRILSFDSGFDGFPGVTRIY